MASGGADHDEDEGRGHGELGDERAEGRPGDAESGRIDQQQVEHDVERVAGDHDDERGAGVLQAAQHAGRREHEQQRDGAEERDAQVGRRRVGHLRRGAEEAHQRLGEQHPRDGDHGADADREPEAVDALGDGTAQVAGADPARDAAGGAVGQEDAQADHRLEDGGRDAEAGERRGAEVADDRGVGEQEERLGDQREQRREREPEDLPVAGVPHETTVVMVMRTAVECSLPD